MAEQEHELFERAQSIVKKALSNVGQDNHVTADLPAPSLPLPAPSKGPDSVLALSDIELEDGDAVPDGDGAGVSEQDIAEAAVLLTEAVISKSRAEVSLAEYQVDGLGGGPADDSPRCCSADRATPHRIPSAKPDEEEVEEEKEEEPPESREDLVIRETFENYTEYSRSRHERGRLTEKRYLQLLREVSLIGPGTTINTTDAEMIFFKHAADRRRGMLLEEFRECFLHVASLGGSDLEQITEEVRVPEVGVHFYPQVIMSVK